MKPLSKVINIYTCADTYTFIRIHVRTHTHTHIHIHIGVITADHRVFSEESESRNNHRHAVVVQDLAFQWLQSCPCKTKTSHETQESPMKFLEPTTKPKHWQFIGIWESLWRSFLRSETNGIAERAVRRVKEGTSAVLLQSGLDNGWCADSTECYCYLRNIQDFLSDGKTPCERRWEVPIYWPSCSGGSDGGISSYFC